jgi:hypothetical protein
MLDAWIGGSRLSAQEPAYQAELPVSGIVGGVPISEVPSKPRRRKQTQASSFQKSRTTTPRNTMASTPKGSQVDAGSSLVRNLFRLSAFLNAVPVAFHLCLVESTLTDL